MDFVLLGGLWLEPAVWDDTVRELESLGHRGYVVTLPGQGDGNDEATLDDQLAAAIAAVEQADEPWVVGHSAACTLAWMAADRRPDAVRGVALIGGFPSAAGEQYAPFFPLADGLMAFPGWEPFEGADSADLTPDQKQRLESVAVAVPEGVSHGVVSYRNDKRRDTPVALICPEFTPDDAKAWIASGDVAELAGATHLSYVDLDSGHWPMVSKPVELARVLAGLA